MPVFRSRKYRDENITGVYLNCAHKTGIADFSFWLGTQDEVTVFSAYYTAEGGKTEMNDVEVPYDELQYFIDLSKKIELVPRLRKYRRKMKNRVPSDPECTLELKFSDTAILGASFSEFDRELILFFYNLSDKYK